MNRVAWQATAHGVARVARDLATEQDKLIRKAINVIILFIPVHSQYKFKTQKHNRHLTLEYI